MLKLLTLNWPPMYSHCQGPGTSVLKVPTVLCVVMGVYIMIRVE